MKKLELMQMENLQGNGQNRQCLIDGALTVAGLLVGGAFGGLGGYLTAAVAGGYAGNSHGCFG